MSSKKAAGVTMRLLMTNLSFIKASKVWANSSSSP